MIVYKVEEKLSQEKKCARKYLLVSKLVYLLTFYISDLVRRTVSHLRTFRDNLDPVNQTINAAIKLYSNDNELREGWVGSTVPESNSETSWQLLIAHHMLLLSKEEAGVERALGSNFYARGSFPLAELLWYTEKKTLGETYLLRSMQYSDTVINLLDERHSYTSLSTALESMRKRISVNNATSAYVVAGLVWFNNMTSYINILKTIQDTLAKEIVVSLNNNLSLHEMDVSISIFIVVGAIVMFSVIVLLVYRLNKKLPNAACVNSQANDEQYSYKSRIF